MKLYIADNLKRLRQARGLTQEALADHLGVSFQAVSRWEGGNSYPDIELIPEIATFFEVSTDTLMGVEKVTLEKSLAGDKKRLRIERNEGENPDDFLALAQALHRKYPHDAEILHELIYATYETHENPAELRRLILEYFAHKDRKKEHADYLVHLLVTTETQETLPAFLDTYASDCALSREQLLSDYFLAQNDWATYDKYQQFRGMGRIYKFFDWKYCFRLVYFVSKPDAETFARTNLAVIHLLTDYTGDKLLGDGEPDLWHGSRVALGYHLAGQCVCAGKIDEAYAILDEVVSLCERFYAIPDGTRMTYRSPQFPDLAQTWRVGVRNPDDVRDFSENCYRCLRSDETFYGINMFVGEQNEVDAELAHDTECPVWDIAPLVQPEWWSCFDVIREEPRYQSLVGRMQALIVKIG